MTIARWPSASGAKKVPTIIALKATLKAFTWLFAITSLFSLTEHVVAMLLRVCWETQSAWKKYVIPNFNPFPNKPWFLLVCSTSLLKTVWEKEKLLLTSNFSFPHSVFYLFWEPSAIFSKLKIVNCRLFQFGRVKNLSFGKELIINQTANNKTCPNWKHLQMAN